MQVLYYMSWNYEHFCVFSVDIAYSYFVTVQYRLAHDTRVFVWYIFITITIIIPAKEHRLIKSTILGNDEINNILHDVQSVLLEVVRQFQTAVNSYSLMHKYLWV